MMSHLLKSNPKYKTISKDIYTYVLIRELSAITWS